jgi:Secretion system C-terminal sorting domain
MKKSAIILILCLATNLLLAQSNPFVKGYNVNADGMSTAHNFRQTNDHGFILSSIHGLSGPDSAGISTYNYLIKLDANGQPVWTTKYPKIACYPPSRDANAVTQARDGGFAVATGYYYCSGNYFGKFGILLIKTDSLGTISWSKAFTGPGTCAANCIQATSDNGFVLAGTTWDTITHQQSYFMIKTDSLGQPEWQKTYHNPYYTNGGDYGVFYSVIQTHDGGYLAVGDGLDPCNYGSVVRLDANGEVLWSRKNGGNYSLFNDVQETSNHQYIVSGKNFIAGSAFLICKMDDFGNTIWAHEITTYQNTPTELTSVVVENDGYTFAGVIDTNYQQSAILHTDTSGNVMWCHSFPQPYPTICPSIALADSGYAYSSSYVNVNGNNGWYVAMDIIKTDQQGWSTCTMQTPPYTVNTFSPLGTVILNTVTEDYPVFTLNIQSVPVSLTDTSFCLFTGIAEESSSSVNLFLYPNPTNGNAYLQLPKDGAKYQITLYNELGQLVDVLPETTSPIVELPTSGLATGMYVVRATTEKGINLNIRLIKTE